MNILHNITSGGPANNLPAPRCEEERWMRNYLDDLKEGLDLIHDLKLSLDTLHPLAAETIINLLGR